MTAGFSVRSFATLEIRNIHCRFLEKALSGLSEEMRQLLTPALWLAHLGMILFFIYDESSGHEKTTKLVDGVLDLLTTAMEWTHSAFVRPFVQPFQTKVLHLLQEAGWTGEF